jgi:hypothetical protein
MEHPYRVHSSIGFGFLHLLFMSSLAYPTPIPPVYHNTAVLRMMGTIYFTIFQDKPFYLKLECATILIEMICDVLYIRYIILDYTYVFGVIDVISNALICVFILLSIQNGDANTKEVIDKIDDIRTTCVSCCFGIKNESNTNASAAYSPPQTEYKPRAHMYKSVPSDDYNRTSSTNTATTTSATSSTTSYHDEAPVYTFGGRQAFKPSFYNSSWGRDYIQAKVEREFDRIDKHDTEIGDVGMITGADGTTQYIRFDEPDYKDYNSTNGINHYANIFVSPYFTRDGTPITWFSGCSKIDKIGACLFIYNIIQFIYQLMMYSSIITSCRASAATYEMTTNHTSTFQIERWLC